MALWTARARGGCPPLFDNEDRDTNKNTFLRQTVVGTMARNVDEIRRYWESRAGLGEQAGTQDLIPKHLEIEAILAHVRDGMRILEIGCGNGITAIEIARRFQADILGLDYTQGMVEAARALGQSTPGLRGAVRFDVGDLTTLSGHGECYDLIYTERVLINLKNAEEQMVAIGRIGGLLAAGGVYVMCENSQDGLDRINDLRVAAGLPAISPPWHNLYFRDGELEALSLSGLTLERVIPYSATYYFLSRVVNAWLAAKRGVQPAYDAEINQLALLLPAFGDTAQGKLWLWRRDAA